MGKSRLTVSCIAKESILILVSVLVSCLHFYILFCLLNKYNPKDVVHQGALTYRVKLMKETGNRAILKQPKGQAGVISGQETLNAVLSDGVTVQAENKLVLAYPEAAKRAGKEAIIHLSLLIDADGSVKEASVISSSQKGYFFEENALRAVRRLKFKS